MSHTMAQRVRGFGTSIFSEMSALANQHGAINLSQGFPDFAAPELLKRAAVDALRADKNQYAPSPGLPRLREAIAATYARDYGVEVDPQREVTVTSGATEALFASIMAVVDPGDEVIVFEPAYDAYVPDIMMAGGVPRYVRLRPPRENGSWTFDREELETAFNERTRAIIVNTPHNPVGKVFTPDELTLVARLCHEHDVLAITDEVYDRLVFTGLHIALASLPGMWERTITINSMGKTFSVTGWKIGYALAPEPLTEAIRRAHQFITFSTTTPLQEAGAVALEEAQRSGYYRELLAFYEERRTLLVQILREAGMAVVPPEGTYFVMADVGEWGFDDDVAFCRYLTTEVGVAAIPPSAFYADAASAPAMARFCFAKERATLQAAADRLMRHSVNDKLR